MRRARSVHGRRPSEGRAGVTVPTATEIDVGVGVIALMARVLGHRKSASPMLPIDVEMLRGPDTDGECERQRVRWTPMLLMSMECVIRVGKRMKRESI